MFTRWWLWPELICVCLQLLLILTCLPHCFQITYIPLIFLYCFYDEVQLLRMIHKALHCLSWAPIPLPMSCVLYPHTQLITPKCPWWLIFCSLFSFWGMPFPPFCMVHSGSLFEGLEDTKSVQSLPCTLSESHTSFFFYFQNIFCRQPYLSWNFAIAYLGSSFHICSF